MRAGARIVAAPDRAARYQALHRARSDNDDSTGALAHTELGQRDRTKHPDTPGNFKTSEYECVRDGVRVRASVCVCVFDVRAGLLPSSSILSRVISQRRC